MKINGSLFRMMFWSLDMSIWSYFQTIYFLWRVDPDDDTSILDVQKLLNIFDWTSLSLLINSSQAQALWAESKKGDLCNT